LIPPINWIKTFDVFSLNFLISRVNNITVNENELFLLVFEMDDSEAEYEGTDHYGQQYYSDEETFYDTGDPGKNRFLHETDSRDGVNYSTEEDRRHQIRYSYDETNFNTGADDVNIYGSQERHDHDENHFKTEDSHHGDTTRSKGNACRHFSLFFFPSVQSK